MEIKSEWHNSSHPSKTTPLLTPAPVFPSQFFPWLIHSILLWSPTYFALCLQPTLQTWNTVVEGGTQVPHWWSYGLLGPSKTFQLHVVVKLSVSHLNINKWHSTEISVPFRLTIFTEHHTWRVTTSRPIGTWMLKADLFCKAAVLKHNHK